MRIKVLVNCIYKSSQAARSNLWAGFAAGRPAVTIVIISHVLWASAYAEGLEICLFLRLDGGGGVSGPREGTRVTALHSPIPEMTSYHSADLSSLEPISGSRPCGEGGDTQMWILSGNWKDHCDKCGEPAAGQRRGVSSESHKGSWGLQPRHTLGLVSDGELLRGTLGLGGVMGERLSQTNLTRFLLKTGQGFGHHLGWGVGGRGEEPVRCRESDGVGAGIRGSDGGRGSGSAAEQDSYETGHLEVKVSWSESLAGVFVALEMGFVGTVLSVHLPGGFPGRLSSLKAWSFCSFSFPSSVMCPGPGQFWWHLCSHLCSKKRWFWFVLCCAWCGLGTGRCTATLASALLTRGLGPQSQEDSCPFYII